MTFPSRRLAYNPRAVQPSDKPLVPYITRRAGEDAAPDDLIFTHHWSGPRLYYADEDPRDRDPRGVLWARCGWNPVDAEGRIMGEPQWKLMHPHRQMVCMQTMRCQVCMQPAHTVGLRLPCWPSRPGPEAVERSYQPAACVPQARACRRATVSAPRR